ncbi:hypothetical protein [Brevibacterium linens]|uniref:hypothetical protein n=1 Tax=Brevibacterium linens TaxID=1703 RepID=UPI003F8C404C
MAEAGFWPTNDSGRNIWQGADARQRLNELEIDLDSILACLGAGDLADRQTDEFSPVTASGTERWNHTVQELRRSLAAHGWRVQNPNNSPRIVRPDGGLAIAVVSGNHNTGNPNREPSNAHALGPTVDKSVLRNHTREVVGQLALDSVEDAAVEDAVNRLAFDPKTWILLYRADPGTGVRAELSYPNMTDDGFVSRWQERIIIPTETPLDETLPLETPVEDVPFDIREA